MDVGKVDVTTEKVDLIRVNSTKIDANLFEHPATKFTKLSKYFCIKRTPNVVSKYFSSKFLCNTENKSNFIYDPIECQNDVFSKFLFNTKNKSNFIYDPLEYLIWSQLLSPIIINLF